MKTPFLILGLLICSKCLSQKKMNVALEASYQAFDKQTVAIGVSLNRNLSWPDWEINTYLSHIFYGQFYLDQVEGDPITAIGLNNVWGLKNALVGFDARHVFQGKGYRIDGGPSIRIGYKFIWIDYSLIYNLWGDNPFSSKPDLPSVKLLNPEHNLRLTLIIPISKK